LQIIPLANPNRSRSVSLGLQPHEIELSRDGRVAYVSNFGLLEANHRIGTPGTSISVVDLVTGRETRKFVLPAACLAPHGVKLRPSKYRELFVNTEEGQQALVVFDVNTGKVLRQLSIPPSIHNFVFDGSGSRLYAFATDGNLYRINPDDGAVMARSEVSSPRGLTWTSDRAYLIASGKGELVLLNPDTLAIARRIPVQADQIFYPQALNDGETILAGAPLDKVLLVVNLKTGSVQRRIKTSGRPLQICLERDGARAWVGNVPPPKGDPALE
jgi:DNA-binding beta-propeller fold protein YncE